MIFYKQITFSNSTLLCKELDNSGNTCLANLSFNNNNDPILCYGDPDGGIKIGKLSFGSKRGLTIYKVIDNGQSTLSYEDYYNLPLIHEPSNNTLMYNAAPTIPQINLSDIRITTTGITPTCLLDYTLSYSEYSSKSTFNGYWVFQTDSSWGSWFNSNANKHCHFTYQDENFYMKINGCWVSNSIYYVFCTPIYGYQITCEYQKDGSWNTISKGSSFIIKDTNRKYTFNYNTVTTTQESSSYTLNSAELFSYTSVPQYLTLTSGSTYNYTSQTPPKSQSVYIFQTLNGKYMFYTGTIVSTTKVSISDIQEFNTPEDRKQYMINNQKYLYTKIVYDGSKYITYSDIIEYNSKGYKFKNTNNVDNAIAVQLNNPQYSFINSEFYNNYCSECIVEHSQEPIKTKFLTITNPPETALVIK